MHYILKITHVFNTLSIPKDLLTIAVVAYKEKNFARLFSLLDSQARIWLFIELQEEMDDVTYFQILGDILVFTYTSFDPELFKYLLKPSNRDPILRINMMTKEEQDIFAKLPSTIEVFRGTTESKELGYSWTLSKDIAKSFARRHFPFEGRFLKGTCFKSSVIAYFSREEEIFINPSDVTITSRKPVKAGEGTNTYRINMHNQVWNYMKNSSAYKKIKILAQQKNLTNL